MNRVHCLPVWGINYLDVLERVPLNFFKRLLQVPSNTVDYAVRIECGISRFSIIVFKSLIGWICKVLNMDEQRYPKRCFSRLLHLHSNFDGNSSDYNWVTQVQKSFSEIDENFIIGEQSSTSLLAIKNDLVSNLTHKLLHGLFTLSEFF